MINDSLTQIAKNLGATIRSSGLHEFAAEGFNRSNTAKYFKRLVERKGNTCSIVYSRINPNGDKHYVVKFQ